MTSTIEKATTAAVELLRVSLLAKLATDLGDPHLARRAARDAQTTAHLLASLDYPPHAEWELPDLPDQLPEVDDLLERLHPRPVTEEPAS